MCFQDVAFTKGACSDTFNVTTFDLCHFGICLCLGHSLLPFKNTCSLNVMAEDFIVAWDFISNACDQMNENQWNTSGFTPVHIR